jgi:hypothetical protein
VAAAVAYQVIAQRWHDFYVVAATSSATLVGLLFVGLSLHLRIVISSTEVRSLARVTLANFGLILFVSLFMVIHEGRSAASLQLVISGAVSLLIIAPSLRSVRGGEARSLHLYRLMARLGLSVLGYAIVIVVGAEIGRRSYAAALSALVAVIVLLLVVSLRNSWDLLVSVGEVAFGKNEDGSSPPTG